MASHRHTFSLLAAGLIAFMLSLNTAAQDVAIAPPPGPPDSPEAGVQAGVMVQGGRFAFIGMADSHNKVVKGAPYSAESSTETIQTLSDGNQITRTETSQVYRDSQGRTRREHTLSAIGPWSESGEPRRMVSINDPVAGVHYMLNPDEKTAMKMPVPPPGERLAGKLKTRVNSMREKEALTEPVSESLGTQIIEGVTAQGTRVTETIPAGKIGNARPITIVSERWYSPQLQAYVLTKRSDPRFGDTTYKLTNINTAEPSPDLFQVPGDYSVKEGKHGMRVMTYEGPPK